MSHKKLSVNKSRKSKTLELIYNMDFQISTNVTKMSLFPLLLISLFLDKKTSWERFPSIIHWIEIRKYLRGYISTSFQNCFHRNTMPLFRAIIFHLGEESRVKSVHMFRTPEIQENRTAKYFNIIKLFAHIQYRFVYM